MSMKSAGAFKVDNKIYIRSDLVIKVIKDFNKGLKPQIMNIINELCETEDVDIRAMRKSAKSELAAHNDFTKDLVNTFKRLFEAIDGEMKNLEDEEEE